MVTYQVVNKVYLAQDGPCTAFCQLTLDNGKEIGAHGEAADTLNTFKQGDVIIVGKEVLKTGRFGE